MACLNPHDSIQARIFDTGGVFHTLYANNGAGMRRDGVLVPKRRKADAGRAASSPKKPKDGVCRKP